eukprot:ANDGO_05836.mRNA.1 ABC transporter A family member 8
MAKIQDYSGQTAMSGQYEKIHAVRTSTGSQFNALLRKQAVLQRRQKKTNCCQICFPMFLLLILLLLSILSKSLSATKTSDNPTPAPLPGVIEVFTKGSVASSFPYSVTSSSLSTSIVSSFLAGFSAANTFTAFGGKQIGAYPAFQSYSDKAGVDAYMFNVYGQGSSVPSGLLIGNVNNASVGGQLTLSIYYNGTVEEVDSGSRGRSIAMQDVPGPLMSSVRSFVNMLAVQNSKSANYVVQYQKLPSKPLETYFDFAVFVQSLYYTWILHFLMPVFVESIVFEKEYKLRDMMRMMGLKGSVYWWVQLFFDWLLYLGVVIVTVFFGNLFQLRFFTMNAPGLYILLMLIWGFTLTGFSFFLSTLFKTTRASTITLYFYIILAGIAADVTNQQLMDEPTTSAAAITLPSLIPTFALNRGLRYLSTASANPLPGLTFSNANSSGNQLYDVFGLLIGEGIVLFALFFVIQSWPRIAVKLGVGAYARAAKLEKLAASEGHRDRVMEAHDVSSERARVEKIVAAMKESSDSQQTAMSPRADHLSAEDFRGVIVRNMHKRFITSTRDVTAVQNVSFVIPENSLTAMIGHNGAGKTTLISILSGLIPPTSGEVSMGGYDLVQEMDRIYSFMGVCPQFDILWPEQTGREHLLFYGRIKGLKGKPLLEAVEAALKAVNLTDFQNVRSAGYSGGMKRRLSVAISLMGNPKIVFLDEPTTGLDPHSRREVWDAIQAAKPGRAMILTTHSMEEADALADRITIMNHGRLVAVGHAEQLKTSYGEGYRLSVSVANYAVNDARVKQFVTQSFAGARLVDSLNGTSHFSIPYASLRMSDVFRRFEDVKQSLGITDWGISKTTLEEVFEILTSHDDAVLAKHKAVEDATLTKNHV